MAFKSVKDYNNERYKNLFILRNDKDYADVIFLYEGYSDVMVADAHYIKSDEYSGYVQCCGKGCPACAKGIRVQQKLFIPIFNITANEIQFWDRNMKFETKLSTDVFEKYPDPCNYVFRVTRSGVAGDINTTYSIQAVGKNTRPLSDILASNNAVFPQYYETICPEKSAAELSSMLTASSNAVPADSLPDYQVKPRAISSSVVPEVHDSLPVEGMIPVDSSSPDEFDDLEDPVF